MSLESITTVYSNDWRYCLRYWRVSFDLKWVFWVRSKVRLQLGGGDSGRDISRIADRMSLESTTTVDSNDWRWSGFKIGKNF